MPSTHLLPLVVLALALLPARRLRCLLALLPPVVGVVLPRLLEPLLPRVHGLLVLHGELDDRALGTSKGRRDDMMIYLCYSSPTIF